MITPVKWTVLPIALIIMGTVATAQTQAPAAQGSGSTANPTASAQPDQSTGQHKENQAGNRAPKVPLAADEAPILKTENPAIFGVSRADHSINGDQTVLIATTGINSAMDDLSHAFANRDLSAIRQLWPTIPDRPYAALGKSFGYFRTVSRNFNPENIDLHGDTATVVGTYTGAFGNKATTIPSSGTFHATLKKTGSQWIMASLVCD
jgi:hypothetical protein